MDTENGVIEETPSSAATGESIGTIETPSVTPEPSTEVLEQATQEGADKTDASEQKLPDNFREGYKTLEKDVQRYKPLAEAVESIGGLEVINALKPLADMLLDESADPTSVVQTLQQTLLPQHFEAVAWAALDNPETQAVILEDPEVLSVIANKFFGGKSIEEVQAALAYANEVEDEDPETSRLRKEVQSFRSEQKQVQDRQAQQAAETRTQELQKRFFVDTADEVVKQFNMVAPAGASDADQQLFTETVEDLRYAAQGRFLADNSGAYLQIQDMYAKGHVTQARVAEARLHNKWQATLIKTAERHSKHLQSASQAATLSQQAKVTGVRPDISGNAGQSQTKSEEVYDLNSPDFLAQFVASFKRDAANV